ncbi:MAG: Asp-tRNA(Asn)/Glu-tRNA(Gln) amidotransferase subunit GatB [Lawsonella clevelandensis]
MPVVNQQAVDWAIKIGLALNCEIAPYSRFARKNYFYPDQPKNYQISQYDEPIAFDGYLEFELADGTPSVLTSSAPTWRRTPETTHIGGETGRINGATHSLLDINRAGVPLIEIVTKPIEGAGSGPRSPCLRDGAPRCDSFAQGLGRQYGAGSMRADVNLSLRPVGTTEFGTRTETKNVNTLKSIETAVRYEMCRQAAVLEDGGEIRLRHVISLETTGTTAAGRPKETSADYRYFNDPDLAPVVVSRERVEEIRATLPELPWVRRARLQKEWQLSDEELRDLVNTGAMDLVADTVEAGASSAEARNWWVSYLTQQANNRGVELEGLPITPRQVAEVIGMVSEGKLTNKLARQVVDGVLEGEGDPADIVEKRGLAVVSDDSALRTAVEEALAAQPDVADKIRDGKVQAAGAIIGAVMKATRGQADAARVREIVIEICS